MPDIPLPADRKKTIAFDFHGTVFTLGYYSGTHSKNSINALWDFIEDKHITDPPAYTDGIIEALLGFNMTWDVTVNGLPVPSDKEFLAGIDSGFLEACLAAILGDCLPKEAAGENSPSGITPATLTSEPHRQRGKKKQG